MQKQGDIEISKSYQELLERISHRYAEGQAQAVRSVNEIIVETNWQIGKYIVEYEQGGKKKAEYGKGLLENLSKDLIPLHGKGFSRSNLQRMRQFYITYPICAKPSHKLSWSHWVELLKISDKLERSFYQQQTMLDGWSVPEFRRQKDSGLFMRLALSKNKEDLLVEYATYEMNSQLFISKYQLYFPDKEELRKIISQQLETENESEPE